MTPVSHHHHQAPAIGTPRAYQAPTCARFGPSTLRAGWWALRAWRKAKARMAVDGLATVVPPPPDLPTGASRGVLGVLRRAEATCLERCLVLQAWLFACGEPYEVVVGVDLSDRVEAHAWLAFEAGRSTARFTELARIPAEGRPAAGSRRGRVGR